jgi:ATP-dependent exoDNAse (exonuclease V) alpha subunit
VAAELQAPVVAPTGIAALRIGGQTLHSFFRLGQGVQWPAEDGATRPLDVYRGLSVLIIDEISMVRADVLDKVDWILRRARKSDTPFGGVRVIAFGDLLQLPPVLTREEVAAFARMGYAGEHFFNASVFRRTSLEVHELERVYRQRDAAFVELLHGVRRGSLTPDQWSRLKRRVVRKAVATGTGALTLTARRFDAETINACYLNALRSPETLYVGEIEGAFRESDVPAPIELRLRPGARVMWTKNDLNGRWVNGSVGVVQECYDDHVIVVRSDGEPCRVFPVTWERIAFTFDRESKRVVREVVGRYTQLPLTWGWAATIHRTQGLTLERVHVDLGRRAFAPGQTYVALSRSRTERGLTLARPIRPDDLIVDQRVLTFLEEQLREGSVPSSV